MADSNINVKLMADITDLQAKMMSAQSSVTRAMSGIEGAAGMAKHAMEALGVGLSVHALVSFIEGGIKAQASLKELSLQTGLSVEILSALRPVANQAGTTLENVAGMVNKLEKNMLAFAQSGGGKAADAFKQLGYSQKEVKTGLQNIDTFLPEFAKRLIDAGVGGETAGLAMQLMAKGGAAALPFLERLVENGVLNARVSTAQAEAAHEFEVNMVKLKEGSGKLAISFSNELLPTLIDVTKGFIEAKERGADFLEVMAAGAAPLSKKIDAIGNAWFDWSGNAQRKNIDNLKNDLKDLEKDLKAAQAVPFLNIYGDASKIQKDIEAQTALLKAAQAAYLGLDKIGNAGRGMVNPAKATPNDRVGLHDLPPDTKLADEGLKLADSLLAQSAAMSADFYEKWSKLSAAYKGHTITVDKLVLAQAELLKQQPFVKKLLDEAIKVAQTRSDLRNKEYNEINTYLQDVANAEDKFWRDLLAATPSAQLEEQTKAAQKIHDAFMGGRYGAPDSAAAAATYGEVINTYLGNIPEAVKASRDAADELGMSFSSAFEDAVIGGKNLGGVLQGLEQDILRITLRKSVTEPMANYISGGLRTLFGSSFAGGGYTGAGPRSGGLDGMGGFPALLHPQETVIDHARGQTGSSSITINIDATVGDVASKSDVVDGMHAVANQIVQKISRSQRYGGA